MSTTTDVVTRAPRRQPKRQVRLEMAQGSGKSKQGRHMSPKELATVATLTEEGVSIRGIAALLNRSESTIAANLKASQQLMQAFAPDFAQHWKAASAVASTRGDHRPAMDALERLKVVERPKADVVPAVQIAVGISLPGLPSQPAQTEKAIEGQVVRSSDGVAGEG